MQNKLFFHFFWYFIWQVLHHLFLKAIQSMANDNSRNKFLRVKVQKYFHWLGFFQIIFSCFFLCYSHCSSSRMYFGQNRKKVLPMFYQLLPRKRVISAGLIFIGRTEKSCVENVPKVVIRKGDCRIWFSIYFNLFMVNSIHSIRKSIRNSQKLGYKVQVDRIIMSQKRGKSETKEKKRSSKEEINWYAVWK